MAGDLNDSDDMLLDSERFAVHGRCKGVTTCELPTKLQAVLRRVLAHGPLVGIGVHGLSRSSVLVHRRLPGLRARCGTSNVRACGAGRTGR